MTPVDPCANLLARGAACGLLDANTLAEAIGALKRGEDYLIQELGFEWIAGRLRLSLLDEKVFCDPEALVRQLEALQA